MLGAMYLEDKLLYDKMTEENTIIKESNHDTIVFQLGELKGIMQGVLTQMNIANGRTGKLEGKVEMLEKRSDMSEGALKAIADQSKITNDKKNIGINIWSVVVAGLGVLMGLVGAIFTYLSIYR